MKIAPKSHFHTAPAMTLLGSNVNDTLGLFLTIPSLEWCNGRLVIVGSYTPNSPVEVSVVQQPVGISFYPNADRWVKESLQMIFSDIPRQAYSCYPQLKGRLSNNSICIMLASFTRFPLSTETQQ